jgi:DNA-binding beta-propeller fold protein YncE
VAPRLSLAVLLSPILLAAGGLFHRADGHSPTRTASAKPQRPKYLNPLGVAVDHDGGFAYVALSNTDELAVVDLARAEVVRLVPCPGTPTEIAICLETVCVKSANGKVVAFNRRTFESETVSFDRIPAELDAQLRLFSESPLSGTFGTPPPGESNVSVDGVWFGAVPGRIWLKPNADEKPRERRLPDDSLLGTGDAIHFARVNGVWLSGALGFAGGNGSGQRFQTAELKYAGRAYATPSDVVGLNQIRQHRRLGEWRSRLAVATAGSDAILFLDRVALTNYLQDRPQFVNPNSMGMYGGGEHSPPLMGPPRPAAFVSGAILVQSDPRRLAVSGDGKTLVASNCLSDSLSVMDLGGEKPRFVRHIPLNGPPQDAARRGEILFHSARLTANGQFTCATCHPGGGSDGAIWDMPGDDLGPRRTKSLLGIRDRAPYGWLGDSPTLAHRVRKTLVNTHHYQPTDREVEDLVAYLETLPPPVPQPIHDWYRGNERSDNQKAYTRGKTVFEGKAGCIRCHQGESMQDGRIHDVGTGGKFRTPSLRGFNFMGPLLHDGSADHARSIFENPRYGGKHGRYDRLTDQEKRDLFAFLQFS